MKNVNIPITGIHKALFLLLMIISATSRGQEASVLWPFNATTGPTPSTTGNIDAQNIVIGPGLISPGFNDINFLSFRGIHTQTLDLNDYIQFEVSPQPNNSLKIDNLSMNIQVSRDYARYTLRYSTSPTFSPYSSLGYSYYNLSNYKQTLKLSNLNINIPEGKKLYIRLYVYYAPDINVACYLNNFTLEGNTTAIVPPATIQYDKNEWCTGEGIAKITITGVTGGSFSSSTGLDIHPQTGDINLANSIPGGYTIKYSLTSPVYSTTTNIMIHPSPDCTISDNQVPVYPYTQLDYSAPEGLAGYSWSITGNGTISGDANQPIVSVIAGQELNVPFTLTLVTDGGNGCTSSCTKEVAVEALPLQVNIPGEFTCASGMSQNDINEAFENWLAQANFLGGCNAVMTTHPSGDLAAPPSCGGSISVEWTVVSDCQNEVTGSATFTVPAVPEVKLTVPGNYNGAAGMTQNDINEAFEDWLVQAVVTGGRNAVMTTHPTRVDLVAPPSCGGSISVEWTVASECQDEVTESATFTVPAVPEVKLTVPGNYDGAAGMTQNDINEAFEDWLAQAGVTGGRNTLMTTVPTGDDLAAPPSCGGSIMVEWTVVSDCQNEVTGSATFTVPAVPEVKLTVPGNYNGAAGMTQNDINEAFEDWLVQAVVTGGRNAVMTTHPTRVDLVAPPSCGGSISVEWTVVSECQDEVTQSATFTVPDIELPTVINIYGPLSPVQINTTINLSTDDITNNIRSATWLFSPDGTNYLFSTSGNINSFTNRISGEVILPSGVYTVKLSVIYANGQQDEAFFKYIVVYDPDGGFVTGGGWIYSRAGSLVTNPDAEGKANFGFVSKYKTGKNSLSQVEGNTSFQFSNGNFLFISTSHEEMSLVISGAKATYRGIGTVNGKGTHKFMVSAVDGDISGGGGSDKYRIKIFKDGSSTDVLYDNQMNEDDNSEPSTIIGGGSIVIHNKKSKSAEIDILREDEAVTALFSVYPNPFNERLQFIFNATETNHVRIELFNGSGQCIKTVFDRKVEAGVTYEAEYYPQSATNGIYFYRITAGEKVYTGKAVFRK
jgi:methionine-rich copper-binding protein CopC